MKTSTFLKAAHFVDAYRIYGCCHAIAINQGTAELAFFRELFDADQSPICFWWDDSDEGYEARIYALLLADILWREENLLPCVGAAARRK